MSATVTGCKCCGEEFDSAQPHGEDVDLGLMCLDCAMGALNGLRILAKAGVLGIFRRACPDNSNGEGAP